jgi:hypothetical protein
MNKHAVVDNEMNRYNNSSYWFLCTLDLEETGEKNNE